MGAKRFIAEQQTYYGAAIRRRAQRCDMRSSDASQSATMRRMGNSDAPYGAAAMRSGDPPCEGSSSYAEQRPAAATTTIITTTTTTTTIIIIILARFRDLA